MAEREDARIVVKLLILQDFPVSPFFEPTVPPTNSSIPADGLKDAYVVVPGVVSRVRQFNDLRCETSLTALTSAKGIFLDCQLSSGPLFPRKQTFGGAILAMNGLMSCSKQPSL